MKMTVSELIDTLNQYLEERPSEDPIVEIHQQPNWPLKSQLVNVKRLVDEQGNVSIALACGPATEYGTKEAWEDEY